MASYERRGKNSFRLRVELGTDGEGKRTQRMKTIKIEDEALLKTTKRLETYLNDELTKFKLEVQATDYIRPEKLTFTQFVEEWRNKYAKNELSPKTFKTYDDHIKTRLLPVLGKRRMDEIKPMHIVSILSDLRKPTARKDGKEQLLSDRTIVYIYSVMKHLFNVATDWKVIKNSPMENMKKPKLEKKKAQYYEADEAEQVIKALQSEPIMWRMLVLGAMIGGLRRGELVALEWPDILFEQTAIHVRKSISLEIKDEVFEKSTKNDEDRYVEMPIWYMAELEQYKNHWVQEKEDTGDMWRGGDKQYLFHAGFGEPLYYDYPSEWWGKFIHRHNLKKIRFHDLRHTSATLSIELGVSTKALQERLGHKQHQTTTDIYAHVTKKVSRDVADKFERFDPSKIKK